MIARQYDVLDEAGAGALAGGNQKKSVDVDLHTFRRRPPAPDEVYGGEKRSPRVAPCGILKRDARRGALRSAELPAPRRRSTRGVIALRAISPLGEGARATHEKTYKGPRGPVPSSCARPARSCPPSRALQEPQAPRRSTNLLCHNTRPAEFPARSTREGTTSGAASIAERRDQGHRPEGTKTVTSPTATTGLHDRTYKYQAEAQKRRRQASRQPTPRTSHVSCSRMQDDGR